MKDLERALRIEYLCKRNYLMLHQIKMKKEYGDIYWVNYIINFKYIKNRTKYMDKYIIRN